MMRKIDDIIIVDHMGLISQKKVTEEGRKQMKEISVWMSKFIKDNNITFVNADGKPLLK